MFSLGFWIVFAVALCAVAEGGMRLETWWRRRRDAKIAKPPAIARENAARRRLGRAR